jgi:hypothetical protein
MKSLFQFALFYFFGLTIVLAQSSPRLLFTQSNYDAIKGRYISSATVYNTWYQKINAIPLNSKPDDPEPAEYDQNMGLRAKIFAFRYAMEQKGTTNTSLGDVAYNWIIGTEPGFTNVHSPGYEISPTWNRWMVNGLALINYCQAYDMLVGSGYYDVVTDGTNKKTAAKNKR